MFGDATKLLFLVILVYPNLLDHHNQYLVCEARKQVRGCYCNWNSVHGTSSHGLYLDTSTDVLKSLRAKMNTTHQHIYQDIQFLVNSSSWVLPPADENDFLNSTSWNAWYGIHLPLLSFYCLLNPEDHKTREHVFTTMDRLTSYSLWKKHIPANTDLTVTHILAGVATAFNFMKHQMNRTQEARYLKYLFCVGRYIDMHLSYSRWGGTYIHNHGVVHATGLFHAALVLVPYCKCAAQWRDHTVLYFERMMQILDLNVDGSMNEGTGYGSYTVNCFTQFFYLAKRHMGLDYLDSVWARKYYDFILGTTLPGHLEIIGIGDSNRRWHSSAESQLVFWDTYVLRNGEGNWLASKIRSARKRTNLDPSWSEYTEYIWYDPSLGERSPFDGERKRSRLFRYSNTGMAVYNGGRSADETLVSFKSGPLHGRAVYTAINERIFPWLTNWTSVNPGHEHPDANSFVFYPHGQPFITENFYTFKYSFLNNVLTFGPSSLYSEFPPHAGQLGEAKVWLKYKESETTHRAWSESVCADEDNGIVVFSGEAVGAYDPLLKLQSVYRVLILLNPDVLLVIDHIERSKDSKLQFTNAYFSNIDIAFDVLHHQKSNHPNAILKGEKSSEVRWMSWPHPPNRAKAATFESRFKKAYRNHYVNISVPLADLTRIMYLFSSSRVTVDTWSFSNITGDGVSVTVRTSEGRYTAMVATNYTYPSARLRYLGDLKYARVLKSSPSNALDEPYLNGIYDHLIYYYLCLLVSWCLILLLYLKARTTRFISPRLFPLLLLPSFTLTFFVLQCDQDFPTNEFKNNDSLKSLPLVALYSLNGFGSSVSSKLFEHNTDFNYTAISSSLVPKYITDVGLLWQACGNNTKSDPDSHASKWIHAHLSPEDVNKMHQNSDVYRNTHIVVLDMQLVGWGTELLQWFTHKNPPHLSPNLRLIHVVSDPRTWVAHHMKWDIGEHLQQLAAKRKLNCPNDSKWNAKTTFDYLLSQYKANKNIPQHKLLAMYWEANTAASLSLNKTLSPHNFVVVRYEDLMDKPVETAKEIYSFIGLSFPMTAEFTILQQTQSKQFSSHHPKSWMKTNLRTQQISDIENICLSTMSQLGYTTSY